MELTTRDVSYRLSLTPSWMSPEPRNMGAPPSVCTRVSVRSELIIVLDDDRKWGRKESAPRSLTAVSPDTRVRVERLENMKAIVLSSRLLLLTSCASLASAPSCWNCAPAMRPACGIARLL